MNIKELLLEATYKFIDKLANDIFDEVIKPYFIANKKKKDIGNLYKNITNYFKEFVDIDRDVWLVSIVKDRKSSDTPGSRAYRNKKFGTLEISLNISDKHIREDNYKNFKNQYFLILKHEIIHILDDIKAKGNIFSREAKYKLPGGEYHSYKYHHKDESEFNAIIHEIEGFIKFNKKTWNKITNLKTLQTNLELVYPVEKAKNTMDVNQYNNFIKKVIKRLTRENLMPSKIVH